MKPGVIPVEGHRHALDVSVDLSKLDHTGVESIKFKGLLWGLDGWLIWVS